MACESYVELWTYRCNFFPHSYDVLVSGTQSSSAKYTIEQDSRMFGYTLVKKNNLWWGAQVPDSRTPSTYRIFGASPAVNTGIYLLLATWNVIILCLSALAAALPGADSNDGSDTSASLRT